MDRKQDFENWRENAIANGLISTIEEYQEGLKVNHSLSRPKEKKEKEYQRSIEEFPQHIKDNWENYCKTLRTPPKTTQEKKRKEKKQLVSYEKAKRLVFDVVIEHEELEKDSKGNWVYIDGRPYVMRTSIQNAFIQLTKYFIQDPTCSLNLYKGIFIHGSVGVGKTTFAEVFEKFTNKYNLPTRFKIVRAIDVGYQVQEKGIKAIKEMFENAQGRAILFDDIGAEQISKRYGVSINTVQEIIYAAMKRYKSRGKLIHATSNLGSSFDFGLGTLSQNYDPRIVDRANELFNFLPIIGKSFR